MACIMAVGVVLILAADSTPCRGDMVAGLWGKTCPASSPVCCYQENGSPAACCPEGFSCDLRHGDCVAEDGTRAAQQDNLAETAGSDGTIVIRPEMIVLVLVIILAGVGGVVLKLGCQELRDTYGRGDGEGGGANRRPILYSQLPSHMIPDDSGSDVSVGSAEEAEWLRSVCARRAPSPRPSSPDTTQAMEVSSSPREERRRVAAEEGQEMATVSPDPGIDPEIGGARLAWSVPLPSDSDESDESGDVESRRTPPPSSRLPSPQGAAEELTCQICFDARANCLLLDCAHLCVCYTCGKRLKLCPFCRKAVRKRKRVRPGP
eukprot:Hpha_TRINITY_DN17436_c0_g1::TRINITY_DN17436_c0_g1_i1::g.85878::m.85878